MTTVPSHGPPPAAVPELSRAKRALLEQRLRRSVRTVGPAIPRRQAGAAPPLSYAQERIWFMEQFAPGTGAYGSPLMIRLGAGADLTAFGAALREVSARHESLRMRFPATEDGRPTAVVDPPSAVPLPVYDVPDEAAATAAIDAAVIRPFDLAAGPLLRAQVLRVAGGTQHVALLDLHHIVTDGWSNDILLSELGRLYRAARTGGTAALPTPVQYGDFAAWQRVQMAAAAARRHVDYWLDKLAGVPALELPTDAARPPAQSFAGASHYFRLEPELVTALVALGKAHGATLFMTLLAAYQAMLSRYTGQTDFAVGSPVAGRSHPDLDGVIGMFNNMLVLRADLTGAPTAGELIDRVRAEVLDALAHQDVPFEQVINELEVARDVSRSPLFQAMFVLQNYQMHASAELGADLSWQPVDLPATRFDLELHAYNSGDGGLQCRIVYNTALFEADTAERLANSLRTLLADLLTRPNARVGELDVLDPEQRALLARWNRTDAPSRPDATLVNLFTAQVARTPGAVAVVDERGARSYAALDAAANRMAHRLRAAGVGVESVVAVCAERSVDLVSALLGVLKTGAAYLPLDPEYPADRLAYMLADAQASMVLTQRRLADRLPETGTPVLLLDDARTWGAWPDGDPEVAIPPGAAAYLIYTSGSTGRPKGVVNSHRGIVNRLDWMQAAYGLGTDDVVLQKTPAGFDVSVWEFFWPLATGARLVLARPGGHRDPAYLRELIGTERITVVHFVPSMLAAFLADGDATGDPARAAARCATVRLIVSSGEELPAEAARRCVQTLPWASLHNLYGPTEAAVDVTAWRCSPVALAGRARLPIGAPISNVRVHVLDERLSELPIGAVGELHIGGVQVARGYHRRPALTAARFVPDPFGPPGSRLYATGDLARWRPDGTVEFLGRIDGQVKLRGLRIELGEIEVALREQPGIRDAAVVVTETGPGDKRLVGYVVGTGIAGAGQPDRAALRQGLARRLPDYMVPSTFVALDALPASPNGKLDRAALPAPELVAGSDRPSVGPRTAIERAVAEVWCDVLGLDRSGPGRPGGDGPRPDAARPGELSIDDDFFALGGHSLLATQVVAKLRVLTEGTGRQVGVMDLFGHPTVRGLAALIDRDTAATGPRRLLHELTRPVPPGQRVCSYVCVPYGGGSAVVYQPLADALPPGHSLYSVAIPGHDVGLDEDAVSFDELARRCADEVADRVDGPLVLYGHCGGGGALVAEVARLLEAAGRRLEAVYVGGSFPFARPRGALGRLHGWLEDRASNQGQANWLKSIGMDMGDLDPEQADRIVSNMRRDSKNAEEHFTRLLAAAPERLSAPIISVVGERDPITDYYQEQYRDWRFLTDTTAVVVLDEAGHYFLRYRAEELSQIITTTHSAVIGRRGDLPARPEGDPPGLRRRQGHLSVAGEAARPRWWLEGVARAGDADDTAAPVQPSMRRFAVVSAGQLVSAAGSALTSWAIPVWIYLTTGSLLLFGLSGVVAVIPILLATPVAGAVADSVDRRRVIIAACGAAAAVELVFALLLATHRTTLWLIYLLAWLLSFAGAFQRIAYTAAIPQLAPKRYLGHANGVAQLINGAALLFVPVLAAGMLAVLGLTGILVIDIVSYAVALAVLAVVRFPDLMGRRRRETFGEQVLGGLRLSWGTPGFRAMLAFYGITNLFYAVPVLLVAPLVLGFGTTANVGQVSLAEGIGALLGGLAMAVWGGPRRRRMVANILMIAMTGGFVVLTGLRPNLAVVFAGVLGTALCLAVANGIYLTVIQVKVPHRFHGRVIGLNQTLAWSTLPIGFALLVPASGALEPLLAKGGALAGSVGAVTGTGPGRGLGFAYVLFGLAMAATALVALGIRALARLDTELPDALPDDLVGVQVLARREGRGEGRAASSVPVRPATPTQHRIARAWAQALNRPVDQIGVDDDFFGLGGHSLSALRVVSSLDGLISLDDLVSNPALGMLAAVADSAAGGAAAGGAATDGAAADGAAADSAAEGSQPERGATPAAATAATPARLGLEQVPSLRPILRDGHVTVSVDLAGHADRDWLRWIAEHRAQWAALLLRHGALLVTGLPIHTAADLARVRCALGYRRAECREQFAARRDLGDGVYTPPEWAADREQCLHHEQGYGIEVPRVVLMACLVPAHSGGAMLLGDSRAVLHRLPADLQQRFRSEGWTLERNFRPRLGLPWSLAFGAETPHEVERYCDDRSIDWQWRRDRVLRLTRRRAAIVRHPITGDSCWFNDVAFFSQWSVDRAERDVLLGALGRDGLPFNTSFGGGGPLDEDAYVRIVEAYKAVQRRIEWQAGDLLVLDNLLTAHGREPYRGTREVTVAPAEAVTLPTAPPLPRPTP